MEIPLPNPGASLGFFFHTVSLTLGGKAFELIPHSSSLCALKINVNFFSSSTPNFDLVFFLFW